MYLATLLTFAACGSYLFATLRGDAQPNRVSWLMWGLIAIITAFAQWLGNGGLSTLVVLASAIGPLSVFIASFANKKAYWKTGRMDIICGLFSAIGLVGWVITKNPSIAILFCIFADLSATVPTYRKAWIDPGSEHLPNYILGALSGIVAVASIPLPLTFNAAAYMTSIALSCCVICLILIRGNLSTVLRRIAP